MKLEDYTYELPESLIAHEPPTVRGSAKLLSLSRATGEVQDKQYADIVELLQPGDCLVLNDTWVIRARLTTTNQHGAERELVVLEKHGSDTDWHSHRVMHRGKLRVGDILRVGDTEILVENVLGDGLAVVRSDEDLLKVLELHGTVPLPPYMQREAKPLDIERYQTVWAKQQGSVAAPTASLNMTEDTLQKLRDKGVRVAYLTLHVGLGTFMPIRVDKLEDHHMHEEYFHIPHETIATIRETKQAGHRVIALGTTVTRALEYSAVDLMEATADVSGEADIFMYPGYQFKLIDGLVTNFHAPKSTVLMLTAAFAGWEHLREAYQHAVAKHYHFLSYGDSMIIL